MQKVSLVYFDIDGNSQSRAVMQRNEILRSIQGND